MFLCVYLNTPFFFVRIPFIRISRLKIAENQEYSKNNAEAEIPSLHTIFH